MLIKHKDQMAIPLVVAIPEFRMARALNKVAEGGKKPLYMNLGEFRKLLYSGTGDAAQLWETLTAHPEWNASPDLHLWQVLVQSRLTAG